MHPSYNATAAELQQKFGMCVIKRAEKRWNTYTGAARTITTYAEPVTGDSVNDVRPVVAVRRLLLPYLVLQDGPREYLLNREYNALWMRHSGGQAERAGAVSFERDRSTWFYSDATPEPERIVAGRRVYAEWRIALPDRLTDLVAA